MENKKSKKYVSRLSAAMAFVNVVFMLIGSAVLGTALWVMLSKDFMSSLIGTRLMTVSLWFLIVSGSGILLVSILGFCAVRNDNTGLLLTYICIVIVIGISLLIGSVIAIVFRLQLYGHFRNNIRDHMKRTLQEYYGVHLNRHENRIITEAWDTAQRELYCCAVNDHGWSAYRGSNWAKVQPRTAVSSPGVDRLFVPESCCRMDLQGRYRNKQKCQSWHDGPPGTQSGQPNEALLYRGCFEAGSQFASAYSGYLIGTGIGVVMLLVCALVTSAILYKAIPLGRYQGVSRCRS